MPWVSPLTKNRRQTPKDAEVTDTATTACGEWEPTLRLATPIGMSDASESIEPEESAAAVNAVPASELASAGTADSGADSGTPTLIPAEAAQRLEMVAERCDASFSALYAALEWQMVEALGHNPLLASAISRGPRAEDGSGPQGPAPSVFGITSAISGEGKTTVALHLALAIARNTCLSICLLDLSLGEDTLCRRIGARPAGAGTVDVLEGVGTTVRTIRLAAEDNLAIIPAGRAPRNPGKVARSAAVPELIAATRQMFDLVVVDLPAVSTGNALPLAVHVDKLLMVVRAGVTPKDMVTSAVERMGRHRTAGIILNRHRAACPRWLERRLAPV